MKFKRVCQINAAQAFADDIRFIIANREKGKFEFDSNEIYNEIYNYFAVDFNVKIWKKHTF